MALMHPSDHLSPASRREATKHPMICLASGFAVLIGTALLVHLVFTALF